MGFRRKLSVVIIILAIFWRFLSRNNSGPKPLGHGSFVAKGWEKVQKEFQEQLDSGLLKAGAFSVYHRGRCVVDLSGGYASEDSLVLWDNETLSHYFSATKGVASVVMAMLVDRGLLDYKKPVSSYWPEFAQNGKKDITVEQLLSHQAGLITIDDGNYSLWDFRTDPEGMKARLAAQKPYWEPGTKVGYHALTKGFYENELVKILDPGHRSMRQFFQEEVTDAFGIDFYIGVPREQFYRVSKNHDAKLDMEFSHDPSLWSLLWMAISGSNPYFSLAMTVQDVEGYWNNPYFMELNSPATHGVGTASSLAKFFGILANGGVHEWKILLSEQLIAKLSQPLVSGVDLVLPVNWTLGPGTMIMESPKGSKMFGTPGSGGQNAYADPENQLGLAYLTNYMSFYGSDDPRFVGLLKSVYEVMEDQNRFEHLS